jgi:YrbI family 3-deoxy-D-manno-octulosonate 8-phosphate phosphatase
MKDIIRGIRLVVFDFDGVFTDDMVYVQENGIETVRCYRGDGIGLQLLKRRGIEAVIVSTETNPVVSARARKLKIHCVQNCQNKHQMLEKMVRERNISFSEVAFVGNDINDLAVLNAVGFPIVVQNAHHDVVSCARYQTKIPGGYGAVREVCDLIDKTFAPMDK